MTIAYDAVHSTNIRALAFNDGIGYVEFNGGRRFAYRMPRELFDKMKADRSIGGFFAKNVKGKCPVVWNGHCCDASPCQRDAEWKSIPPQREFTLCGSCFRDPRFRGIAFEPYVAPGK